MKKKIGTKIIVSIVVAFLLLNVIWGAYYLFFYRPYAKIISDASKEDNVKYTYSIDPPYYLHYEFNIALSENRLMTSSGEDVSENSSDILVWPKLIGEDEYGVIITYVKDRNKEGVMYGTSEIRIDKQGHPLDHLSEEEENLFSGQEATIQELLTKIHESWGI